MISLVVKVVSSALQEGRSDSFLSCGRQGETAGGSGAGYSQARYGG